MAKKSKVKRFSIQTYDASHYKQTEAYTKAVEALFDRATIEISNLVAKGQYDPNKPFSFSDYPSLKSTSQQIIQDLTKRITATIESGSKKQWLFACQKNDEFIKSIMDTSKLSKSRLQKMQDKNLEALQSFQGRKVNGMNLSKRVWNYTDQYKDQIEQALDVGLGDGRSAQELARDVKQNLKDPNRLYRRVRDKRGNLVLSKNAKAFHPGQGVYRSSVKNAQRLTRSEINMAYRESDFQRWQGLDFVVGFEIKRSNHKPLCDCSVCKKLAGVYPKEFKFKGWHPQCMCYAVPILMDDDTYNENELGDLKAALRGTTYTHKAAKNTVVDVPQGFKDWVDEHKDLQDNWKSVPYFITDNFVNGKLSDGLILQQKANTQANNPIGIDYSQVLQAIEEYIGGDGMWINQYLRGIGDFGSLSPDEQEYLNELTRLTTQEKVGEQTLWRSADAKAVFGNISDLEYESLKEYFVYGARDKFTMQRVQKYLNVIGKDVVEAGFMSTTRNQEIAENWGDYTGSDCPIVMKIKTTSTTRGFDVEKYTKIHNPQAEEDNPQEEILLSKGQKYKVVNVYAQNGNLCVEVELYDEEDVNNTNVTPKIDPIQQELDNLIPQIINARNQATKWGLSPSLSLLDKYVAEKNPEKVKEYIAIISQKVNDMVMADTDIRQKCRKWGVDTSSLDKEMLKPNFANILKAMADLETRAFEAENEYKKYIVDAQSAIDAAKNLKIDYSSVEADLLLVKADVQEWVKNNGVIKQRLDELKKYVSKQTDTYIEFTQEQIENHKELEKILGVKQGEQMSFDNANELRGNPNYQEKYVLDPTGIYIDTTTKERFSKNPLYKKGYTINCQSCVVANELRRRGFDVQAKSNSGRKDSATYKLSINTKSAWLDEKGNVPDYQITTGRTIEAQLALFELYTKEKGRYHISWTWKSGSSGHIITCERLSNGQLRIYDPQNGQIINDFKQYASRFSLYRGIKVLRVDNLRVNTTVAGGVIIKTPKPKNKKK